jgi:hypothetical protein
LALPQSQKPLRAITVGHVRGMHDDSYDQAWGLDQQVALAPIDLLAAVIAAGAAHHGGFG